MSQIDVTGADKDLKKPATEISVALNNSAMDTNDLCHLITDGIYKSCKANSRKANSNCRDANTEPPKLYLEDLLCYGSSKLRKI